jgi:hypothetical protein
LLLACPAIPAAGTVSACSIDGVPSITVNGAAVVINRALPTGSGLKLWAPFLVPFPLHAGRNETFAEIKRLVALTQEGFAHPWRWTFGDGTPSVRGTIVHHIYRRPGTYKVTVEAYFASHKFWYTFDALHIHVVKS